MRLIKRVALLLTAVIIAISIIAGVTIYAWLNDARLSRIVDLSPAHQQLLSEDDFINFDEESVAELKAFRDFYLFTKKELPFDQWSQEKIQAGEIEILKGVEIFFKKELSLPGLIKNDCQIVYCFQYRLPFNKIPPKVWKGLIGIEDNRYLNHVGVDLKSILRALIVDIKAMRMVQGGSTLSQQLVKNLFLTNEKSIKRKFKEVIFTIYIESLLTKDEILAVYLNEMFWGSFQGIKIKGIYAASLFYFAKKPHELNSFEVAILVSLLKGPYFYGPLRHLDRLKRRTSLVYSKLVGLGQVVNEKGVIWSDKVWGDWSQQLRLRQQEKSYYPLWNINSLVKKDLGIFEQYVLKRSVHATLNRLKKIIKGEDVAVKILIGDIHCLENCKKPFIYYSKEERDLYSAINREKHQVGSILKPIIYRHFLKKGVKLSDMVSGAEITLNLKSGKWTPKEAGKSKEGEISVIEAIRRSKNRPLIRLAEQQGFDDLEKYLLNYITELKVPLSEYPAQLIGAIELSINEVYLAYKKFIREECLDIGTGEDGEDRFEQSLLYQLSNPQKSTIRRVVGPRLKQLRFFGKTGTTNNGLDNWYIYFDGEQMGVIWLGLEGVRQGKQLNLYGSISAFRIFNGFAGVRGKRFFEFICPESFFRYDDLEKVEANE